MVYGLKSTLPKAPRHRAARSSRRPAAAAARSAHTAPPLQVDPLAHVLQNVRLRAVLPRPHEMTAPWGVRFGGTPTAEVRAHPQSMGFAPPPGNPPVTRGSLVAITRGDCWLEVEGETDPRALSSGDLVLLSGDVPFTLRDHPDTIATNFRELIRREHVEQMRGLHHGGGGMRTSFLCGFFSFVGDEDHPLMAVLPPVIHVRGGRNGETTLPWLRGAVALLDQECAARRPGAQCVVDHLAHVLFVQAVRAYANDATAAAAGAPNWFRAMLDPDIAPVIGLMHLHPGEPWSVASLANQAGCSRSGFAAKFTAAVGRPPLQYLTECRVQAARALLRDTRLGIKAVARQVGYATESAFSNAFKRVTGVSPFAYRKSVIDPHLAA